MYRYFPKKSNINNGWHPNSHWMEIVAALVKHAGSTHLTRVQICPSKHGPNLHFLLMTREPQPLPFGCAHGKPCSSVIVCNHTRKAIYLCSIFLCSVSLIVFFLLTQLASLYSSFIYIGWFFSLLLCFKNHIPWNLNSLHLHWHLQSPSYVMCIFYKSYGMSVESYFLLSMFSNK